MSSDLTTAKRRADLWRGLARTPATEAYYHGLRLGLVHAEGTEDQYGEARACAYHGVETTDVARYATSCGYVDGTRWLTGPRHVGLLRLAILLRADGSARAYAGTIETDERTVRRWLAGDRPIAGVTLALLREHVDRAR